MMLKVAEVTSHLFLEELARCEQCGEVLATGRIVNDEVPLGENCPACGWVLTEVSFGCYETEIGLVRAAWVGPEGKWVSEKPKSDFRLGNLLVLVRPPAPFPR